MKVNGIGPAMALAFCSPEVYKVIISGSEKELMELKKVGKKTALNLIKASSLFFSVKKSLFYIL